MAQEYYDYMIFYGAYLGDLASGKEPATVIHCLVQLPVYGSVVDYNYGYPISDAHVSTTQGTPNNFKPP